MKHAIAAALLLAPTLAFAQSAPQPPSEKQLRTERTLHLAAELDLEASQALALESVFEEFDARRKALGEKLHAAHAALSAENVTQAQVDQNVQALFDVRAQMSQLDQELFRAAAKGLTVTQRAKLALVVSRPPMPPLFAHPPDAPHA